MYTLFFAFWWESSNLVYRTKLQSSILIGQSWINTLLSRLFSWGRRFSRNSCCNCHRWTFLRCLILNLRSLWSLRTTRLYHHVFINSFIFSISIALLHLLFRSQRLQINILEINACWSNVCKRSSMIKILLAMTLLI